METTFTFAPHVKIHFDETNGLYKAINVTEVM